MTQPTSTPVPPESLQRKLRSESILRHFQIPVNEALPPLPPASMITLRDPQEVARRAIILTIVAGRAQDGGLSTTQALTFLQSRNLADHLTENERAFLHEPSPDDDLRAYFASRYESAWALCWAIDRITKLEFPTHPIPTTPLIQLIQSTFPAIVNEAKLRSKEEILDALDMTYRHHHAVRAALIEKNPPPPNTSPWSVYERHYAFNWLTNYLNFDWDNVSTDT